MIIFNGRFDDIEQDYEVNTQIAEQCADTQESILRVWRPKAHVSFGPRDVHHAGFEQAKAAAHDHGLPVNKRQAGGHAVVYTGNTVAFGLYQSVENRGDITARYDAVLPLLQDALQQCGVDATEGEPEESFCPGSYSLSCHGKIVGTAQRVRRETAVTSGIVVCKDDSKIADVLDDIYPLLDIPFTRESMGSIGTAGGTGAPEVVMQSIETSLSDGEAIECRSIRSLLD